MNYSLVGIPCCGYFPR